MEESISHGKRLYEMMEMIYYSNGGFRLKGGVKNQRRNEHKALLMIKEEMITNYNDLGKIKGK